MGHKCGHFVAKQVACNSYFVKTNTWTTDFVAQGMQTQKVWDVIRPTSMFSLFLQKPLKIMQLWSPLAALINIPKQPGMTSPSK